MDQQQEQLEVAKGLQQEWGIAIPELISEEKIIEELERKVVEYLQAGPDAFFQLMYRLDISESKLMEAMYESNAPATSIARLIYLRQLQKYRSRKKYGRKPGADADDELAW